MEWDETDQMEKNGIEYNKKDTEWNGMEQNKMEWNGREWKRT